jgi:hypothetical protein
VLLTNVNYRPYLEKRFPGSRVESLCEDLPGDDDGLMLFWTPYNRTTRDVLDEWGGFDLRYQGISEEAFFFQDKGRTERAVEGLLNGNEGWRKDPFLRAQWAERVALYASMPPRHDLRPALTILQEAVRTCPSAHLYDTLGIFWMSFGNTQQAERSFQAACRSPLNHTSAASNLELLSRIKAQ